MQNALQSNANYDQHNAWYNSMFATEIKTEPITSPIPQHITPPPAPTPTTPHSQLEQYLKQQHQQNISAAMNGTAVMTPSPHNNDAAQHFFDAKMQQQIYQQQQQYQQQFRQAQQAAAQNQMVSAAAAAAHLPLGFNPLTPPGLPMANLPHFYNNNSMHSRNNNNNQQTPSPQPGSTQLQITSPMDINSYEKLQSALTPRNTPPMETQSAKEMNPPQHQMQQFIQQQQQQQEHNLPKEEHDADKEHETMSNSSEDLTNLQDEAKYYESIRVPRYNSHGKLRTYPCKSCPQLYDTKAEYWEHLLTHMKPEKILRCPMYPKCPFVTEYKHFLDFHLKKHRNQKPFKCPEGGCKYSCETKGMLTSHLKSHSDVYPYKCGDCDYAVKFIHSFKQHLRKYEHKPGLVLDDKGKPNPAAVIDVYGRRRGPKSKGANTSTSKRDRSLSQGKSNNCQSQLSAALQGIKMAQQLQQHQQQQHHQQQQQHQQQHEQPMCISPAKSNSSTVTEQAIPQRQQNQMQQMQLNNLQQQHQNLSNLLPPLASILQQNTNMAQFFPYWNLNLQVLAAQQQAAVLAQLSPRKRELALQQLQSQQHQLQNQQQQQQQQIQHYNPDEDTDDDDDDDDDDDVECKSIDSAMDLSQPAEEERRTPENTVASTKVEEDINVVETPIGSSMTPSRRKGRVLQLDTLLQVQTATQLAEKTKSSELTTVAIATSVNKLTEHCTSEESMENGHDVPGNGNNTSASSTSNDSGAATSSESDGEPTPASKPAGAVHECKYCDIYFKDPVLYTIHMGYHSCDDVFKCNMCGEKCDGPVGLFVHMARNAHA